MSFTIVRRTGKLSKHGTGTAVIIPKDILERLPWREGDPLALTLRGEHIILQKIELPRVPGLLPETSGVTT